MDFDDHHYHHRRGRGNQAVFVNPSNADIHLNRWGSSWDWMIFTVMVASLFLVLVIGAIRRHTAVHALYAAVLATSVLAYFSMASNLGATPIPVEFRGGPGVVTRQIFFARHVEWIITTPLLVLSLLLLTTFTLSHIFTACFAMVLATTAALLASLTPSKYKFGYFVLGIAALVYVLVTFVRGIRRAVSGYTASYTFGIAWLTGLFLLYPICWGVSEGGNVIGVNAEVCSIGPTLLSYVLFS